MHAVSDPGRSGSQDAPTEVALRDTGFGPVAVAGQPVVSAAYFCVRDLSWGTVSPAMETTTIGGDSAHFRYEFSCTYEADGINLRANGVVHARADGSIILSCETTALRSLRCARIGWVIILPLSYVGSSFDARGPSGSFEGVIPNDVTPQLIVNGTMLPMIGPFAAIRISDGDSLLQLEVDGSGSLLEIEDQRNWADASFKIYQPPLSLVTECTASEGEVLRHHLRLSARTGEDSEVVHVRPVATCITNEVTRMEASVPRPAIGLLLRPSPTQLATSEFDSLAQLVSSIAPDYLRLDADGARPFHEDNFAIRMLRSTSLAVEIDIRENGLESGGLARLARLLDGVQALRVHILGHEDWMPSERLIQEARSSFRDVPILAGSDGWFAAFNRSGPLADAWDGASWGISPQIHDFDDAAIIESHESVGAVVDTARVLAGPERMLVVSPLVLHPDMPDEREPGALGGAWLRSTIESLARARIDSVTVAITASTLNAWHHDMSSDFLSTLRDICSSPAGPIGGLPDAQKSDHRRPTL
jgi:D-apionolactonase